MKVKNILIIIMGVLLVVSTVVFTTFLGIQLNSTASGLYETYLSDMSEGQAKSLDLYLSDVTSSFKSLTELPAVKTFVDGGYSATSSQGKAAQELMDALVSTSAAKTVVIYDASGNIVLSAGAPANAVDAAGICAVDAQDYQPVASTVGTDNANYTVSIKAAVGKYNVAAVYKQDSTGLRAILKNASNLVFIVDPTGTIVTTQTVVGKMDNAPQQYATYQSAVANAGTTPTRYVSNGNLAYVMKTANNWTVAATNQLSAATSGATAKMASIAAFAVAMCIVFFVVGIILIIAVTKPFYKISDTLLKISRGDHDARVDIMSRNEYGDIARVFNDIMDTIIVSESRYKTIIEMSDNIIFEWNFQNNEVTFSNNFNKKFSYRAPSDHFADSFLLKCKVHPDDANRYKSDLEKLAKGENFKHNEYRWKNIYGDYIWVLIRTATINDKEGNPIKVVGVIVDIDRAKKSENMLTARASFDSLTGVYNRETIESAINNEIELIGVRKNQFAILFVDIDDFKFYNDQYSHATGDQVLRFTATTIKNAIGENGLAGRYGGDEFIICLKNAEENDPALIAESILNTLKEGFDSDSGDHLSVNVSIGISIISDNTKRVDEIIGQADDAMYKIKKAGKSNYGFLQS
ncbi:MAG: diguanylate cyclase [Oscillospiraceae bacterium]|nr:diguanylate cyclase [Oscillospiraceae bacterium]